MPDNASLFDDLDPTVILRVIPQKVAEAEERVTNTAIDLMALRELADAGVAVDPKEVAVMESVYTVQKAFLDSVRAYQERMNVVIKGGKN